MALIPISEIKANLIVNNLIKASTEDLNALTDDAYRFIHIASGFIAHYNKYGFIEEYSIAENLGDDILKYRDDNQHHNFTPGERDYEYMFQKQNIYNRVCEGIRKHRQERLFAEFPYKIRFVGEIMANSIDEAQKIFWEKMENNDYADFKLKIYRG